MSFAAVWRGARPAPAARLRPRSAPGRSRRCRGCAETLRTHLCHGHNSCQGQHAQPRSYSHHPARPVPMPVPVSVPTRRPRSSTAALPVSTPVSVLVPRVGAAARGCQARRHDVEDNVMSGCQAPPVNAPLARRRAALYRTRTPHLLCDRADSGPLAAFSSLRSVGMAGRPIPPSLQSEKRTQRPKLVAIAESPLRSDSAGHCSFLERPRSAWRLRRPWRWCSGPLLRPAIRRNLAVASDRHLTMSRGPRDEALRNSATPTGGSGRRLQVWGRQIRNPKSEIRNFCDGRAAFLIPHSRFIPIRYYLPVVCASPAGGGAA